MKKKTWIKYALLLTLAFIALAYYLGTYYDAGLSSKLLVKENEAIITYSSNGLTLKKDNSLGNVIICPENKVDYQAYFPLAKYFYDLGYQVSVVKYPFNVVYLGGDRYRSFLADDYNILVGHGEGIIWVSRFLSQDVKAIISLGGYVAKDLSASDIPVLNILGGQDKIFKYDNYRKHLDSYSKKNEGYVLELANHSYFGDFGLMAEDGTGYTYEQQFTSVKELIIDWLKELPK